METNTQNYQKNISKLIKFRFNKIRFQIMLILFLNAVTKFNGSPIRLIGDITFRFVVVGSIVALSLGVVFEL